MIIGITGGIGSGKSTVTRIFQEFGYSIVDADKIAKNIMNYGTETYYETVERFGDGIVNEDKSINRSKLAELVFNDREKLSHLNRITHKAVREQALREINELKRRGTLRIAYDCPLPVKNGFIDLVDVVVVVWAPFEKRISLIKGRDPHMSDQKIQSRMNNQMNDEEYLSIADHVIENTGTMEQLRQKTINLILKVEH